MTGKMRMDGQLSTKTALYLVGTVMTVLIGLGTLHTVWVVPAIVSRMDDRIIEAIDRNNANRSELLRLQLNPIKQQLVEVQGDLKEIRRRLP